jgi:hypothetical protein
MLDIDGLARKVVNLVRCATVAILAGIIFTKHFAVPIEEPPARSIGASRHPSSGERWHTQAAR